VGEGTWGFSWRRHLLTLYIFQDRCWRN